MNDFEEIKNLFDKLGIEYETSESDSPDSLEHSGQVKVVRIGSGVGYVCFYTEFYFDIHDGRHLGWGVWE